MIRNAKMSDVKHIQSLVNTFAKNGEMLTLSLNEIYEKIYEFVVWEENNEILGCCALHPTWEDLAEIRSIAIKDTAQGKGIGRHLVEKCINIAKQLGIKKIFALTYKPLFFEKLNFIETKKENLPKKIWSDCLKCHKFPDCDEIAFILEIDK